MKKLIVALDVPDKDRALKLVDELSPFVDLFKVGPILFLKEGPSILKNIKRMGKKVFLDLKFHDIPQTVKRAVQSASDLGVYSLTVHSSGGEEMIKAAKEVPQGPQIWAVTVLTSQNATKEKVLENAGYAKKGGADGVIASALEVKYIKESLGADFTVVTPGIRLKKSDDDQKRVATPSSAVRDGADFIVVGRPIIEAEDPAGVARQISDEIRKIK